MRTSCGRWNIGLALAAVLLLACPGLPGCVTVGPDYAAPRVDMPRAWSAQAPAAASAADRETLARWWTRFEDPVLTGLVGRAMAGNLDLKAAVARVRQARAQRRVAGAGLLPGFTAGASGSASKYRADDLRWLDRESYSLGLDVAWEADVFGGVRREAEAARADQQAAEEDLRDVLVGLAAETATSYVLLRTYQTRLATAGANLKLQEETLELTRIKFQTGLAGALDLEQATYNLEATRSQIPDLEKGLQETMTSLAVLTGAWPGEQRAELGAAAPIPRAGEPAALGVPADLLRRRPDIRAAERRLAARTARVGAAESDLYPKLSLSGSLGWEALTLGGLISPAALVAVLGSGLTWTVFNLESVRGNIEVQDALQEEALIAYEAALRTAVGEVENALTGVVKEGRKQRALAEAVASARAAAALALQGYENGISDFQNVLTTQQSLTTYEDKLAQSRGQSALNLIVLYKALGGGWSPEGLPTAPSEAGDQGELAADAGKAASYSR